MRSLCDPIDLRFQTTNSQQCACSPTGGQASDEAFFNGTLFDVAAVRRVVPSAASGGHSLDYAMVETWCVLMILLNAYLVLI